FDQRGHLKIIDRAKDVGRLNDGALFAPKYLENRIKFYPEVREAVAFGQGHDYVTMLVNIDLISVGNWAERNNVSYASYQELAAHPQVYDIVAKRVDELNKALADEPQMAASQIRRFLILHKELDADDGKTSMLNVINGFYHPQEGVITFKGKRRRDMRPYIAASQGIARTFQNVALFKGMSTLDNIMTGRTLKMRRGLLAHMLHWGPAQ